MSVTPRTDEVSRTITLSAHGPVETATHNARSLRWMREHAETLECELAQAQGEIVRLDGRDIAEWRDHAAALGRALSDGSSAHDKLMERSVGAMAIAEGAEGHEAIPRDCPMLVAVSALRDDVERQRDLKMHHAERATIAENKQREAEAYAVALQSALIHLHDTSDYDPEVCPDCAKAQVLIDAIYDKRVKAALHTDQRPASGGAPQANVSVRAKGAHQPPPGLTPGTTAANSAAGSTPATAITEARHEIGTCNDDAEQFPVMEAVDQFGWCAWVRPLPGYRMQCCGCGLVHELDLAIIEDVNLKADGSWDARNVVPEGLSPVFRMRRSACPDPSMGKFACTNRAQCWEPCGDLGNDDRYVGKADSEVSAAVDRAMGIDREKPVLAVGNLLADAAREALWVMEHGNTDEPGEPGRLAAVRWTAAKKGLRDALAQPVLSQDSTNLNPASHVRCTEGSGATPAPIRSEPSGLAGLGPDSPISGNLAAGPGAITFAALTPPKCIYCGEPCTGNYYGVSDAQGTRCWHNPTCPATGLDAFTDAEVNAEFKRRNQPPPNPQAPTMKEPR